MCITAAQSHQLPSFEMASNSQISSLDSVATDTSVTTSDSISSAENTPNSLPTALPTTGISVLH